MEYYARVADQMLRDRLDALGAILIEGPIFRIFLHFG